MHFSLELILFLAYLALGPELWAFYGVGMFAGRRRMSLMDRPPHPIKGRPPRVSILIPAKDEGARIRACLESALAQDYPDFELIAIDDRSTDETGAVMERVAAIDPRLRVVHITQPPEPGWTGKNNALWTGQQMATGDWLLFVDSDVILEKDALTVAMSVVLRKEFDLLSLLPRLESHTVWESLLVPLAAGTASTMYLIAFNNNSQIKRIAFANGQFMLMSRSGYDAIGGHQTVRDRYCEDVEIARLMKVADLRPRVSWGNQFCSVRMYSSLGAIFRGWSRIYYSARVGSPWTVLSAMFALVFCCFSAYAAIAWGLWRTVHPAATSLGGWGGAAWLAGGLVHLAIMTWLLGIVYLWSGNPRRNALMFPVAGPMVFLILLRALRMCVTKKVEWRGTAYSHTMAQQLTTAGTEQTKSV
ncbi:MAG: glycosyl transferase family 2 [Phycisphaerales bacterium]|jgi:chlorobactene glucosyltransferase|nr:glycosyl transferase family 2 [Phycisphaerales bacterium]